MKYNMESLQMLDDPYCEKECTPQRSSRIKINAIDECNAEFLDFIS